VIRDPASVLRPLLARGPDLDLLRAGEGRSAQVVRVSDAVETTLRRTLRDDPTAPIDIRLNALSPEDLPAADLLAELRRRDRIPVEVAAGAHDLFRAAEAIREGTEATDREGALALEVAERLEAHVLALPRDVPLEDPLGPPSRTGREGAPDHLVEEAPRASLGRRIPWTTLAVMAAMLILLAIAIRARGGDDALRQGETAYQAGRVVEAERLFRAALEREPRDPLPRVYLARILREAGRTGDAEALVAAGLRLSPGSADLHVERGFLLLDTGRPVDAVAPFREALRLDRESRRAWGGLVRALRESGRPAEAEQVLGLAPADLRALIRTADERSSPR
jgi:tetratricopeptide (TPR) repeat protein